MAALAAGRITLTKGYLRRQTYQVAANAIIWAGGMVCLNATGFAIPAADTAGITRVVGVATANVNNTGGADGVVSVTVEYAGQFLLACGASITQADVGRLACVADDQTTQDATAATNDVPVGLVREFVSASIGAWVDILANS